MEVSWTKRDTDYDQTYNSLWEVTYGNGYLRDGGFLVEPSLPLQMERTWTERNSGTSDRPYANADAVVYGNVTYGLR